MNRGFTLIELVIVFAIITTISALAIPSLVSAQAAANERSASASLKTIAIAEYDFRIQDRDGNRTADYWTADVFALHALTPVALGSNALPADTTNATNAIRLIEMSVAMADARSFTNLYGNVQVNNITGRGAPKSGYGYRRFDGYATGTGTATLLVNTDGAQLYGAVHHMDRFGFMAFPLNRSLGKSLYIVTNDAVVWRLPLPRTYATTFTAITSAANSNSTVTGTGVTVLNNAVTFPLTPVALGLRKMD